MNILKTFMFFNNVNYITDEEIVNAAKEHEQGFGFGRLVNSKISRGVNSAYGIGFLEGAKWLRQHIINKNKYNYK